jgi:hypothetical protein
MVTENTQTETKPVVVKTAAEKAAQKLLNQQNEIKRYQTHAQNVIDRMTLINDPKNTQYNIVEGQVGQEGDYQNIMDNATDTVGANNVADARLFGDALQSGIDIMVRRRQDPNFEDLTSRTRSSSTPQTAEEIAQEKADIAFATPIGKKIFSMAKGQALGRKGYSKEVQVVVVDGENQNHNPSNLYDEQTLINLVVAMCVNARATRQVVVKPETGDAQK